MILKKGLDTAVHDMFIEGFYSRRYQAGQKIDPAELAAEYQISRTPVVQALKRLQNENILTVTSGGKYFITVPTAKLISDVCAVRYMYEEQAVLFHVRHSSEETRARLWHMVTEFHEKQKTEDSVTSVKNDMKFHRSMIALTGNEYLEETYQPILNRFISIKYVIQNQYRTQQNAVDRHVKIADSILKQDEAAALESLRIHIFKSRDNMIQDL